VAEQGGTAEFQALRPRSILLAAAIAAAAELALYRVTLPVASHIPGADLGGAGRGLEVAAQLAFHATAVLVIAGAALLARHTIHSRPALSIALAAALASVAIATALPGGWAELVARGVLLIALALVVASAWTRLPAAFALAHAAAALAVLAGQWPLLLEDAAEATGTSGTTAAAVSSSVGELALVLTPVLFALAYMRWRSPSGAAWAAAAGAGLLVAALLARQPDYAAIVSTWAVGATLSLPPFLYIVAATCTALVTVDWLREPATRPLAAGLVLLAVAALQPGVVHHNLTAVLALALLATPLVAIARPVAARARGGDPWMMAEVGGHS
jgi:hypothetical protein